MTKALTRAKVYSHAPGSGGVLGPPSSQLAARSPRGAQSIDTKKILDPLYHPGIKLLMLRFFGAFLDARVTVRFPDKG